MFNAEQRAMGQYGLLKHHISRDEVLSDIGPDRCGLGDIIAIVEDGLCMRF